MTVSNPFRENRAFWIWPRESKQPNRYMQFRQEFDLLHVNPANSVLHISTDSSYAIWVNGQFLHCAQFHDWPALKSYDTFNISEYLCNGKNVIDILVYYQGENSAQYIIGEPGLIYVIYADDQRIISCPGVLCRLAKCYKVDGLPRITPQLHFTFEYDSRMDDDWLSFNYTPNESWFKITPIDASAPKQDFCPRVVKKSVVKDRVPMKIVAQGILKRINNENELLSEKMYHDFISTRLPAEVFENGCLEFEKGLPVLIRKPSDENEGIYIVLDCGKEEAGLFELELEANKNMFIDIAYGEHLDDLRVRSAIGGRNFSHRYISKEGLQTFTHYFGRLAGRYIQLHITNIKNAFTLRYAGLRLVEYPIEVRGQFESACNLQNRIYGTAVRTLHLSMHEHYEDCPWREQALYANDSRNQALCGYYCFGEYDFPAASLELLGRGLTPDGYLKLCAPSQLPFTIPSFSMVWVIAVADHLLYSGNIEFAKAVYPTVRTMIKCWLAELKGGLLPCPNGPKYWHFYDWATGLDGTVQGDCTQFESLTNIRYDAPLNLLLCMALEAALLLAKHCAETADVQEFSWLIRYLRANVLTMFFDNNAGAFLTYVGDKNRSDHFAQLTQSLAVMAGTCSREQELAICDKLVHNKSKMVETTLSQSFYKFETLLKNKGRHDKFVFDKLTADWGKMLFQGATSFWETLKGGWDFDLAGSLCHGWSAIPVYFYQSHLLGIKPLEPGFTKFLIHPSFDAVYYCAGHIPTPHGRISVIIYNTGKGYVCRIKHPHILVPVISENINREAIKFKIEKI